MRATGRRLVLNLGAALFLLVPCAVGVDAADVTIDLADQKQVIRGFGGFNTYPFSSSEFDSLSTLAYGDKDDQIGLTILRIYVNADTTQWPWMATLAKAAQAKGALIIATPLLPPLRMRILVDTLHSEYAMNSDAFPDYVAHLNSFVSFMKSNAVDVYAISIQDVPDAPTGSFRWSIDQIHQFTRDYADQITTKVITAESYSFDKRIYDRILNDSTALANIDILGTHTYGTAVSAFAYPLADQKAPKLERWMTEHSSEITSTSGVWFDAIKVCLDIHNTMVEGNFSAYVWWPLKGTDGAIGPDGKITKRGNCMAHYSRFVRPGAFRVETTSNPTAGVHVSAYAKRDSLVIVAVNENSLPVSLNITVKGGWEGIERPVAKFTTSYDKSLQMQSVGSTIKNGFFTGSLDAYSVNTFAMNWWFNGIEMAPLSTTGGHFEIFSVSGTKIADVTVEEGQMLEPHVRRIAPPGGVYLAKSREGGRPILVNVSR